MGQSRVLRGADVRVFISGSEYPESKSITWTIDYGEDPIYGIDSIFPQEIAVSRVSVQGSISGVRIKLSGGLQGRDIRTKINEILHHPYTSLRVKDRHSDRDLIWIPQMKVTSETFSVNAKGIAIVSFNFKGIIPYNPLDMS